MVDRGLCVAETCQLSNGEPCTPCRHYIDLDAMFTRGVMKLETKEELVHIFEKQRRLLSEMNDQHDPLTNRLPREIISHIFLFTLMRKEAKGFADYIIGSPFYLGRICQSWRQIAWSTPSLWNWMHIILRPPYPSNLGLLVKEWLNRAGNLPLTIHINHKEEDDEYCSGPESPFGNFIDHINQRSRLWKNVSFKVPSAFSRFITGSPEGSPNLRLLRAKTTDGGDFNWVLEGPPPQPSYMAFSCWGHDMLTTMGIDWTNLTTVYAKDFTSSECIHLVRHTPRLVHSEFDNVYFGDDTTTLVETPIFVHQSLQVFILKSEGSENVERESFLDSFTFPQLTELRLHVLGQSTRVSRQLWKNSIQPFIARSSSHLTQLSLHVPLTSDSLITTLDAIPSLQQLVLRMVLQGETQIDTAPHSLRRLLDCIHELKTRNEGDESTFTKFLPNLIKFVYFGPGGFQTDIDLPWKEYLGILGPLSEISNPHRHPQDRMLFNLGPTFSSTASYLSLDYDIFKYFGPGNAGVGLELKTLLLEHLEGNEVLTMGWSYSPFPSKPISIE